MHEDVKNFNTLLDSRDRLKCRHYQILHHYFKVFDAIAEPEIDEKISPVWDQKSDRLNLDTVL